MILTHLMNYSWICYPCIGESVEENAYVVVRLLIRRPECFGPALRVEGGKGLLATIVEAIKISEEENGECFSKAYQSNSTLLVTVCSLFFLLTFF